MNSCSSILNSSRWRLISFELPMGFQNFVVINKIHPVKKYVVLEITYIHTSWMHSFPEYKSNANCCSLFSMNNCLPPWITHQLFTSTKYMCKIIWQWNHKIRKCCAQSSCSWLVSLFNYESLLYVCGKSRVLCVFVLGCVKFIDFLTLIAGLGIYTFLFVVGQCVLVRGSDCVCGSCCCEFSLVIITHIVAVF